MGNTVGIVGNGFVGSAIASGFGLHVPLKIYDINPKKSSNSLEEALECDFVFVSVPTPMANVLGGEIDLSIVDSVFEQISSLNKREDNIFILKSTVVPGTVERLIEKHPGLNIVFNPEFLTERSARLDFINASRIVLGGQPNLTDKVESLFRLRFPHKMIIKTDITTSQFIKYMANCFFAVKVSFMNEVKQAADKLGVNWSDAMAGFVSDGRIGNSHLDVPGHDGSLGFGGKCFPKDINAFMYLFEELGVDAKVMSAAWQKNLEVRNNHDWAEIEGAVSDNG
tara:strand:+ start:567 stop:1412 length:846 start_codon:yes stop_codon:yes gene_type:complete